MTPGVDASASEVSGISVVIPRAWTVIAQRTLGSAEWGALPRQMSVEQMTLASAAGRLRYRHRHAGRTEFLEVMAWGDG